MGTLAGADPHDGVMTVFDAAALAPQLSDWMVYDDLPEAAKNAVRHWSHSTPSADLEFYARQRWWQTEQVPAGEMQARVMAADPCLGDHDGTFAGYHSWYLSAGPVPDHGTSRWPVIERHPDDDTEGYLDDGWHRLHAYMRAGDLTIPLLRHRKKTG